MGQRTLLPRDEGEEIGINNWTQVSSKKYQDDLQDVNSLLSYVLILDTNKNNMAFLTKDDLISELYEEVLEAITRGDDTRIDTAIGLALGEAQNFIGIKYDVDDIYSKVAEERDPTVLRIVKDIAVFRLHGVLESTPEDIQTRYDSARRDLELIAGTAPKGNTIPLVGCKLRELDEETEETQSISYINRAAARHNYF